MYMTIDEAIAKYKEITNTDAICPAHCNISCDKCVQESGQLADWLEELKALKNGLNIKCDSLNEALEKGKKVGYNKALDDFVKALQEKIEKDLSNHDLALECKKCGIWKNYDIEKIAEQLKEGVRNED